MVRWSFELLVQELSEFNLPLILYAMIELNIFTILFSIFTYTI